MLLYEAYNIKISSFSYLIHVVIHLTIFHNDNFSCVLLCAKKQSIENAEIVTG